jgi:DNA-binding SARP family transcriptional activator/outer membrane protein assembly factor BamB
LHANEVVSRDRLIEELWGEAAPATVNTVLNGYVSRLRRVLADGSSEELLTTKAPGYVLRVSADRLDARRFEALLQRGGEELGEGDARRAAATLRAALSLWRGPPLADLAYEQFAQSEIRRLEELRFAALESRIEADLALGKHGTLVAELDSLVREHPFRERLHAQLMLALYRSGRQAEALEVYRRARQMFADELGIDPGLRLAELERAILRQDASLDAPSAAPTDRRRGPRVASERSTRWTLGVVTAVVLIGAALGTAFALRGSRPPAPQPVTLTGNSVAVIDLAAGTVADEIPVGARPSGIAAGGGAIWAGNRDDHTLLRIDPRSRTIVRAIGLMIEPRNIVFAARSVWVASDEGVILRVDPTINEVVATIRLEQESTVCCPPTLAVADGALAVAHHGRLSRIDTSTNRVVTVREAGVASIAYGHRSLWILMGDGSIERLDPNTNSVLDTISREPIGAAEFGGGIAVGGRAVWTAAYLERSLWKIDPVTGDFIGRVALDRRPAGVAFGAGAGWIITTDGTLVRFDPRSDRVVEEFALGVYAAQAGAGEIEAQGRWAPIAVRYGAAWVAVSP